MKTVLEEVTSETIDAQHVRRRVDDSPGDLRDYGIAIGMFPGLLNVRKRPPSNP